MSHTHTIAQVTGLQGQLDQRFRLGVDAQQIGTDSSDRIRAFTDVVGGSGVYRSFEFRWGREIAGAIITGSRTTTYSTSSDYRLKTDITSLNQFSLSTDDFDYLDNQLPRVMAWRPVRHSWTEYPEEYTHGFIAHELQAVSPFAVTGEKDAVEEIGTAVVEGETLPDTQEVQYQEVEDEDGKP